MKFLFAAVLSCIVLCEHVHSVRQIEFGPFDASAQIGNLYEPYMPLSDKDEIATASAIHFAEWARSIFPTGLGSYVPALDPYMRNSIEPFELNGQLLKGVVHLSNLVKSGSQAFRLNKLVVRLNETRVDFDVSIPELKIDVDFLTNLTFDNAHYDLSGHLNATARGVKFVGATSAIVLGLKPPTRFRLMGLRLDIHADDVVLDAYNIASRRSADQSHDVMKQVSQEIKDTIAQVMVDLACKQADEILEHFTVDQVMSMLLGGKM